MVYGGPIFYDISETEETLNWYQNLIKSAPDELNGFFAIQTIPPFPPFPEHLQLKKICGVVWAYSGPAEKAESIFKPIRSFKKPALDFAGAMPYPALQSMFDALLTPGLQWYWKGDFINDLSKEAIKKHIEFGLKSPTWMSGMHLYPVNGAASRVDKKSTAWNYRNATWSMVILGIDPDPANKDKISAWAKQYWEALHPYSAGGAYSNFMMEEGEERVKASFGDNYARLVAIKNKYDPKNLFRVNQNIKPTPVNVDIKKAN
jgi:hypothetical protein